jgi:hypothetical protein
VGRAAISIEKELSVELVGKVNIDFRYYEGGGLSQRMKTGTL